MYSRNAKNILYIYIQRHITIWVKFTFLEWLQLVSKLGMQRRYLPSYTQMKHSSTDVHLPMHSLFKYAQTESEIVYTCLLNTICSWTKLWMFFTQFAVCTIPVVKQIVVKKLSNWISFKNHHSVILINNSGNT